MRKYLACFGNKGISWTGLIVLSLFAFWGVSSTSPVSGQNYNNNNNNRNYNNNNNYNDGGGAVEFYRWGYRSAVGGFEIDAEQALKSVSSEEVASMSAEIAGLLAEIPADLDQPATTRKISLKRLSALLDDCAKTGTPIPDSALFLGGLTGIDYVVAVPEEKDIYLAGPAEGWTVSASGEIVGKESGKPILRLEDLLTIFRSWNSQTPEVITCSIDPTSEGIAKVTALGPDATDAERTEAMGLMTVSFSGIPADSRIARILAAADYRLKTISLGYEKVDLKNFPSYFSMLKRGATGSYGQRFWITPEYKTIRHDSDALAWNLTEPGIVTMTEREYFTRDGGRDASGKKDANASKWASTMSKRYDEVSKLFPVFAEAKNCMDLALVVALVYSKGLSQKSGLSLETLTDPAIVSQPSYPIPAKVPGFSLSRTLTTRGDSVSVTGGFTINPWEALEKNVEEDPGLDGLKTTIAFAGENWWSN